MNRPHPPGPEEASLRRDPSRGQSLTTLDCVTAVIPHYGNPGPTLELVAALKRQEGQGFVSIVVSDDASPTPFDNVEGVEVIRRARNGGFGSAVNSGMQRVKTDLVLVLNSDLEIGTTFVVDLLTAAEPWQPAVVSPQILGRNGKPQGVGRHFTTTSHQVVEWLTPLARFRHLPALREAVGHDTRCSDGKIVPVDWVIGAAMLIPVPEFRAAGGFDEQFFMNAEEVDLQRRLRELGIPSVFAGTVTSIHEGGGSSDPARRRQWLIDARLTFARKWGGERPLRAALTAASIANYAFNIARQAAGRDVNAVSTLRSELGFLNHGMQP